MLFDVLHVYKAQKLTEMLYSKDGSMKRKKSFFSEKTVILSCSPKKWRSFIWFDFFREVVRFCSSQCVQNFFSKKFLLFVIFPFFCFFGHFLEKTTKNGVIFGQIYGTFSEMTNDQKMFIFRSQSVLRPQLRFRNRILSIA